MCTLTSDEIDLISGATLSSNMGIVGGVGGAYYGAAIGGSIGFCLAFMGLIISFAAPSVIWKGVYYSVGIFAAGAIGGAVIGSAVGTGAGMAGGYVADKMIERYN